jgi:hypothetical protein
MQQQVAFKLERATLRPAGPRQPARTCSRSPGVESSVLTSVVLPSPLSPTIRTLMNFFFQI